MSNATERSSRMVPQSRPLHLAMWQSLLLPTGTVLTESWMG